MRNPGAGPGFLVTSSFVVYLKLKLVKPPIEFRGAFLARILESAGFRHMRERRHVTATLAGSDTFRSIHAAARPNPVASASAATCSGVKPNDETTARKDLSRG
jgi:hypothetical protein